MPLSKCIQNAFWLLCTISLFSTFFVAVVWAEVVLDGTVGQKGAVSGPNYVITDKMGPQAGSNLFHSFQTFTINADAVFLSPDSDITASSQVHGKEGNISVNSPVQDIVNAMVPLRESFLKAGELLPERCETRDPETAGSFIVDGDED